MTIRSLKHARRLLPVTLVLALAGCASAPAGLVVREESGTRSYLVDTRNGYFWTDSDGVTDVILLDEGTVGVETPGHPGKPLLPGRERALVHTVHIRVNWKQKGRGIGEPDPTNSTLDWLIQERGSDGLFTLARYRGAGHARVDPGNRQATVTLKDITLRRVHPATGQPDPLDRFQLSGGATVEESRAQVERLRALLQTADELASTGEPPAGGPPPRYAQP